MPVLHISQQTTIRKSLEKNKNNDKLSLRHPLPFHDAQRDRSLAAFVWLNAEFMSP